MKAYAVNTDPTIKLDSWNTAYLGFIVAESTSPVLAYIFYYGTVLPFLFVVLGFSIMLVTSSWFKRGWQTKVYAQKKPYHELFVAVYMIVVLSNVVFYVSDLIITIYLYRSVLNENNKIPSVSRFVLLCLSIAVTFYIATVITKVVFKRVRIHQHANLNANNLVQSSDHENLICFCFKYCAVKTKNLQHLDKHNDQSSDRTAHSVALEQVVRSNESTESSDVMFDTKHKSDATMEQTDTLCCCIKMGHYVETENSDGVDYSCVCWKCYIWKDVSTTAPNKSLKLTALIQDTIICLSIVTIFPLIFWLLISCCHCIKRRLCRRCVKRELCHMLPSDYIEFKTTLLIWNFLLFVAVIAWSIVPTLLLLLVNTVVTFAIVTLTMALFVLGAIAITLLLLCIVVPSRTGSKLLLTHRSDKNIWHFFGRIMNVVAKICCWDAFWIGLSISCLILFTTSVLLTIYAFIIMKGASDGGVIGLFVAFIPTILTAGGAWFGKKLLDSFLKEKKAKEDDECAIQP